MTLKDRGVIPTTKHNNNIAVSRHHKGGTAETARKASYQEIDFASVTNPHSSRLQAKSCR